VALVLQAVGEEDMEVSFWPTDICKHAIPYTVFSLNFLRVLGYGGGGGGYGGGGGGGGYDDRGGYGGKLSFVSLSQFSSVG